MSCGLVWCGLWYPRTPFWPYFIDLFFYILLLVLPIFLAVRIPVQVDGGLDGEIL